MERQLAASVPPDGGSGRPRDAVKSDNAFRTISEVSSELGVPQHVLRFWETKFPQIRPLKRGGGRRYYRPEDIELLRRIQGLLHQDGYTIKGVQKLLKGGWEGDPDGDTEIDGPLTEPHGGASSASGIVPSASPEPVIGAPEGSHAGPAPVQADRAQIEAALEELRAIRALVAERQARLGALDRT